MLGAVVARGASVQRLALVVMCQQGRSSWRLLPNQCRRETSGRASGSSSSNPATPGNAQAKAPVAGPQSNFCRVCGGRMQQLVPPGEHTLRSVCGECGVVDYANPKMVVGCVVEHQGKILLCKRAIEPCKGLWTVPAGYMELNETTQEGAMRETWEEARAAVTVQAPYAHWDIPRIGQAYILFRAQLAEPFTHAPGPESLETSLFAPSDIPWGQLAFSSVRVTLRMFVDDMAAGRAFRVHHGVIDKVPGTVASDPAGFSVKDHMALQLAPPPAAGAGAAAGGGAGGAAESAAGAESASSSMQRGRQ